MPRKKQHCRFRIPWISGPSIGSQSRPPKQKSKSPATNVSTHRPPFRPPGIASAPQQSESPSIPSTPTPSQAGRSIKVPSNPAAEENTRLHSEPKMKSPMKEMELATENSNAPLETQSKSHQSKSKANDTKHGQSIPRPKKAELHETASASGVQAKDASYTRAFRADKKQKEARETVERKMIFATSSPSGKEIKVVTPAANKNVSTNEENPIMQKGINDDISTLNPALSMDDKTVSVVTLAGDNRGVTMHVAGSHSTRRSTSTEKDEVGKAYVNSNIQSINNSIMSHGSINGRDPGVRVVLPQHSQPDDKQPRLENHKAEVSINRAERLPYRPVVRRRCLRGLFLEPSDSDPDKPPRHGCKFSCGEIAKDKDTVTK